MPTHSFVIIHSEDEKKIYFDLLRMDVLRRVKEVEVIPGVQFAMLEVEDLKEKDAAAYKSLLPYILYEITHDSGFYIPSRIIRPMFHWIINDLIMHKVSKNTFIDFVKKHKVDIDQIADAICRDFY